MALINKAKEESRAKEQSLNLAQAMQSFARGASAPVSSDALYENLAKQANNATSDAKDEVKRRQEVRERIVQNMMNADKFAYQQKKDQAEAEDRKLARQQNLELAKGNQELKRLAIEGQKTKTDREKIIPASQLVDLAGAPSAINMLDNLSKVVEENKDSFGPIVGRLKSFNPYSANQQLIGADANSVAQIIGKYLEGGKLTDSDIDRYKKQLPQVSDTPEVAAGKVDLLKQKVSNKFNTEKELLAQNYDVNSLPSLNAKGRNPLDKKPSGSPKLINEAAADAKTIVVQKRNPKTGQVWIQYSDGTAEIK